MHAGYRRLHDVHAVPFLDRRQALPCYPPRGQPRQGEKRHPRQKRRRDAGEVDLSGLEGRLRNDETGAPAYHPGVLLKVVLLAYSRGIVGSRRIEAACRENVLFMAVSGDSAPHFTTIAEFVSSLGEEAKAIFTQVLLVCDRQGLIGRQMFAIDGVKLPSNASKAKSGTRAEFEREARKMEQAVAKMLARHKTSDGTQTDGTAEQATEQRKLERLKRDAAQIRSGEPGCRDRQSGIVGCDGAALIPGGGEDQDASHRTVLGDTGSQMSGG